MSALVVAVMALTSCATGNQAPADAGTTGGNGADTTAPADGGGQAASDVRDELIFLTGAFPVTLDPVMMNDHPSAQIRLMIFETLVSLNPRTMELEPGLAVSWDFEDAQTLNMELRQGVYFSNGDPFTADDVSFTIERAIESTHTRSMFEMIEYVEIHDDHNITLHLSEPFMPILHTLSTGQLGIVNANVARELGFDGFHENPVGTGRFIFDSQVLGDRTVVVRNENYWGELPHLRQITFRVIPEQPIRFIEVETGNADIGFSILPTDVQRAEETDSVVLHRHLNFSYNYIGFNTASGPLADIRVRQAIAHALQLQPIIDNAFAGTGMPGTGPLTTLHDMSIATEPFEFDLDRSRELLAEAGFPDGLSLRFWTNAGNQARADVAQLVQSQLRQVNIDVEVEIIEWGTYLEATAAGEHDMFMLGWISQPDPHFGVDMLFHSRNVGAPGNRSFTVNAEIDRLIEEGKGELDPVRRAQIYADLQNAIREELPHIFLHFGEELIVTTPEVRGFFPAPTGSPWLWEVYFE